MRLDDQVKVTSKHYHEVKPCL